MQTLLTFIREALGRRSLSTPMLRTMTVDEIHEFARHNNLKQLGCGTSRCVYAISPKRVIKVAASETRADGFNAGIAQNEAEVDVFTDPRSKPIFAKIYASAADFSWIVSELVRPIQSEEELEKLLGLARIEIQNAVQPYFDEDLFTLIEKYKGDAKRSQMITALRTLWSKNDLVPRDVLRIDHWGKTSDGRAVILDYGFTFDVARKFHEI